MLGGIGKIGCNFRQEQGPASDRHRKIWLAEKITDQLGGIVPAGIFEVDETQLAGTCSRRAL